MNQLESAISQTASELKTLASLLPHNSEINPHLLKARIGDLDAALQQVESQISNTRALVSAERELLKRGSKGLKAAIDEQTKTLEHALAHLPKHLPNQNINDSRNSSKTGSVNASDEQINQEIKVVKQRRSLKSGDSKVNIAANGANKENSRDSTAGFRKVVKKKTSSNSDHQISTTELKLRMITSVAYLTVSEYESVPKYMGMLVEKRTFFS